MPQCNIKTENTTGLQFKLETVGSMLAWASDSSHCILAEKGYPIFQRRLTYGRSSPISRGISDIGVFMNNPDA